MLDFTEDTLWIAYGTLRILFWVTSFIVSLFVCSNRWRVICCVACMITERGCAGYDSRGRLTHAWRIFRVNGLPPSLSLCSWVGRQGRTVVYINGAFPPSCTLRIETLTHSPLHCAHAKPFVRCSLRRTTYVRNSRPPPASANTNNFWCNMSLRRKLLS